ncbi:MAG: selenium-dependent xanthine dehydrogenase [Myxococcaceae bacterium]|nr:selenium-dependent xanthine dehydrogenase [Myxococcaceae bacterium]
MPTINLTVNGVPRTLDVRSGETLLETLRERCGLHSLKDGCAPQGQCGCCLALIDGQAKTTCAIAAEKCDGKRIVTLEGVAPSDRDLLARSFVSTAGIQCGFCIPGIALKTKHLVEKTPQPSRHEIATALDAHLCRCTGYVKVIDAVEQYARAKQGEPIPELLETGGVGASLPRYQGLETVLGDRPYVADLTRPGMLHGAVVFSPHPRAKVKGLDVSAAKALPGVRCVATAADVPGQRWYGLLYADWPGLVAVGEEVRCVGDVLAAIAADDEAIARQAAALVKVDYEVLTPVLSVDESLAAGAPRVNPTHDNVLSRSVIKRGDDVDAALATSAHVVRQTFQTQRIEHLFLEPECAFAEPTPTGLKLFTQGQGIFDDQRQVSAFLALKPEQVAVELVPNGGAFGGKEDMSIQAHAALLCFLTKKPVRVRLTRDESVRMHPKRHPIRLEYAVGCDARGRLTAVKARLFGDSGAYASVGGKVLERAAGHSCGPYRVPHVDVEAVAAYTNNPPCGAMRGFGANQASFAIEGCMDLLAKQCGLDAYEMRDRNLLAVGDLFSTGQILEKSVGIRRTLEAVKDVFYDAKRAGKAVGLGCGVKNSGIGNGVAEWGKCRLVVEQDGTVSLYNGYTEMGQGLLTICQQFAAEVTGLRARLFKPKVDSTFALGCGQTTGSRATLFAGNAVVAAAKKLKADLDLGFGLEQLAGRVYEGDVVITDTTALGAKVPKIKTHTAYGWATQVVVLDATGRIEKVVAAHDVGRVVNPKLCEGQVEGSVHMGLGYALTEELPCENGMPVTAKLRDLGVLRARDMPDVEVRLIEEHEPEGPYGAKGVGEIGLVPTAGAVAGALEAFDGVRRTTLPMKDSPAAKALSVGKLKGDRSRWR